MQVDNHYIYFPEQCQYCTRGLNTTYCDVNRRFMRKLEANMKYENFVGSIDFKCDYFCFDKTKYNQLNTAEVDG